MRPRLRTLTLAGVVVLGGLLVTGARDAKAQVFINTPGFSLGVGTPYVGVYPSYGYVAAAPVVTPVVPYYGYSSYYGVRPYVVGRPAYYGGYGYRPYGGFYGPYRYGYRRW